MAQPGYVMICTAVDAGTGECTTTAWVPSPSFLPPMTVEQGEQLGGAFALLWASCWVVKKARRVIDV